jgi:dihydrodipicolinate synthase/N-acetylneuraminate lyase
MYTKRSSLISKLFPNGIPKLLCPPLTHFNGLMRIDRKRTLAHYAAMSRYVGVFLIPGSTGDGWLLSDESAMEVLSLASGFAVNNNGGTLAAVLKPDLSDMLIGIERVRDTVAASTGRRDAEGFMAFGLKGVTVCAPTGADRTQTEIEDALRTILDIGIPTALYQLPQITMNEISPAVLERLASQYPHFILFKDTSGRDTAALSGVDLKGVYLLRGAEGEYAHWYKGRGGQYYGFLLSTANGFAPELTRIIALSDAGDAAGARALSDKLDKLVSALFDLVASVPVSNSFANASRVADHMRAYGDAWKNSPAPCLPDGSRLEPGILAEGAALIKAAGFMPEQGYLP